MYKKPRPLAVRRRHPTLDPLGSHRPAWASCACTPEPASLVWTCQGPCRPLAVEPLEEPLDVVGGRRRVEGRPHGRMRPRPRRASCGPPTPTWAWAACAPSRRAPVPACRWPSGGLPGPWCVVSPHLEVPLEPAPALGPAPRLVVAERRAVVARYGQRDSALGDRLVKGIDGVGRRGPLKGAPRRILREASSWCETSHLPSGSSI